MTNTGLRPFLYIYESLFLIAAVLTKPSATTPYLTRYLSSHPLSIAQPDLLTDSVNRSWIAKLCWLMSPSILKWSTMQLPSMSAPKPYLMKISS